MVREFSEEKRQEIFRALDEIDNREWKSFMEWCGSSAEEFGDWPDKLAVSAYTRYVDNYHERVLEINEMTRNRVNTVFENVAEIDTRYAGRMRECQEKIKEQIAMVNTMTEFMQSMTDGNPNMVLLNKGSVNENCVRIEDEKRDKKDKKEWKVFDYDMEEQQQPEVIVLDIPEAGVQVRSIIDEAKAQGIIGEPEVAFMDQLMHYIRESQSISFGRIDGLEALYNKGLISEENYNCLLDIKEQTNGLGNYNIFDLKEQARNVYTEIERVIAERTAEKVIVEGYVNEDVLRDGLGWDIDAAEKNLDENFIEEMRALMIEYGLTDEDSIILFLVTISHECGGGTELIERGTLQYYETHGYSDINCGSGLIQLTADTQITFLNYILNKTDDEIEKQIINGLLRGEEEIEIQINDEEKTTIYTNNAMFIAEYYPIESAIWYWCKNNDRITVDGSSRSINECIEMYCKDADLEQFLIASQLTVIGCEFFNHVLGRLYKPENEVYIENGRAHIIYNEEGANDAGENHDCAQPGNWVDRHNKYNSLMYYITGDESYRPIEEGEENE